MLLERDRELTALRTLVDRLDGTGGKVVLIRGEAGIGKSSLVTTFIESHRQDAHVRAGACDDLFIPQPLGPFWDIAESEPSLLGPLGDGDRARLLQAVLALMSRTLHPTVLVIEDTHWADEATLDAVRYIGRRIARTNGLLLLTYRDGEVDDDHPLRSVIGDIPAQDVVRIQLGGLSLAAVSSMVAHSGLDPDEVLTVTRGNPVLVNEMASAPEEGATSSLHDSVIARMRKLTNGSQDMLKTLAVIPEPIPRADALRLDGVDDRRLDECGQRGLLDAETEMVAFRHELIRRTLESGMTPPERQARNRAVLEALPATTNPSLLIHCAVEAGDIDRLLDLAPRSARYAAATGSHIEAAEDFRAVGPYLERIDPEALGPLLDDWAHEEYLLDDVPEAIRLNTLARAHYRRIGDLGAESRALAQAVQLHEFAGQRHQAEELARQAVEVLGPDPEGRDLAMALEANAYLQVMSGNMSEVTGLVARTLEAGGPEIDETVLIRSLNHRGMVANVTSYPDGRVSLDEAAARSRTSEKWYEESRALLMHAWATASARLHEIPAVERAAKAQCRHGALASLG